MTILNTLRPPNIREHDFDDQPELARVMRDLNAYFQGVATVFLAPEFESMYTPPLYLQLSSEPVGIVCLRVRQLPDQEVAVNHGSTVSFVWDGVQQRCKITSIAGMPLLTGKTYKFNLLVVG